VNEFDHAPIDDLDVEITDLDPIEGASSISKVLMAWEERPSLRKRCWRLVTACGTFLLILLVLFSTFPSVRDPISSIFSRLTATHTTASVATISTPDVSYGFNAKEVIMWAADNSAPIIPSTVLGPAPQDCALDTQTRPFNLRAALVAGNSPVWIVGLGGPSASLIRLKRAQPPEIGWYQQVTLLTETNYGGTVTLRGAELRGRTPIWFGMRDHSQGPITSFTVRPLNTSASNHFGSDQQWGLSTATLYVPRSGCYFLTATWPEGEWIVFFSAGR
jgi:hypothetical protein